jgi:hypothetical protein
MPRHAMMWAYDLDDNNTRTYTNAKTRWPSLQAKFTSFPSLGLMTTGSGELISICNLAPRLYIRWPGLPSRGTDSRDFILIHLASPTSFPLLTRPIVRTLDHSIEEHALELSLRLDVGLWPELV